MHAQMAYSNSAKVKNIFSFIAKNCDDCGSLFVVKNTFPVYWAHISILEADVVCMNHLFTKNQGRENFLILRHYQFKMPFSG